MSKKEGRGGARPGAGRPAQHPEGEAKLVAAQVPIVLVEQLDEWREREGLSRSAAITEAVRRLVS